MTAGAAFPFPGAVWLLRQTQPIPQGHFYVLVAPGAEEVPWAGFGMWLQSHPELPSALLAAKLELCRGCDRVTGSVGVTVEAGREWKSLQVRRQGEN